MSESYVETKVREALVAARGSHAVAQKILIAWAAEDQRLLLGMAQPFMKAIAGAAVERLVRRAGAAPAARPQGRPAATAGRATAPPAPLSREALERVLSRMGGGEAEDAPAAAARPSAAAILGGPAAGPGAGAGHEKSMMAIAKAFAAKKMG
ncbi:hypothetical protein [Azospirillum sp. ST 5-10]|uniref:hypothetical protein n=1 Tax=unclassified Azospirillum TaxID=2630922 RepID=UPI003F49EE96